MPAKRRRPMIVAFEETPTLLAGMLTLVHMDKDEPNRWCAACAEDAGFDEDFVKLRPLYRTGDLSGRCVHCGMELQELATLFA